MPLPSWYTPDPAATPAAPAPAANAKLPDWYQPEEQPAAQTDEGSSGLADIGKNALTGLARVPGAIIGLPAALVHAKHWADAKVQNAATGGTVTATDLDKENPITSALPTAEGVDKAVFNATGTQPYEPTTTGGRLGQAAVTGAGAGLVDPLADWPAIKNFGQAALPAIKAFLKANAGNAAKTGLAASAAEGAHEIAPNSDLLPIAAAIATHGGASLTADAGRAGYHSFAQPIVNPEKAGTRVAAEALANADHNLPGLANPSAGDIQGAIYKTKAATDQLGPGLDDYTAGGNIREDLQKRKDVLTGQRSAAAEDAYDAFRASPPMTVDRLQGFLTRPGFRRAMRDAGESVMDEGGEPLTKYFTVENAGAEGGSPNVPGIRMVAPALPPDVLHRIKTQLDDGVTNAGFGAAQRTAKILRDDFVGALDKFYSDTYPKAREDFAAHSRPLDPLTTGPVGKVLDSDTQFGKRTYNMPQDRVADTFLKSRALRSDFDNLTKAYGGDKDAALSNLRENLVSKVQDAINPDGTLTADAFDRSVKPYTKALGMWFPGLAKEFGNAKSAQSALDNVRAQEAIATDVKDGGLRNGEGVVTQNSFTSWLKKNQKSLANTQDPNTVMRLKQIAAALPNAPGAGAEAALEAGPAAVATMAGGSELGILSLMFHNVPKWLGGERLNTFRDVYSKTIEQAVTDPAKTKTLVAQINSRPKGQTPTQALGQIVLKRTKQAIAAAPLATNAAQLSTP